ncbi:12133_t:CDS:2 [Funneliformis mosseae]|uniref:12133_t:CDS:1 n=1 Tax=Funneliformis mosseae TaxID=27381 RepID=A0A9N9FVK8_FUNMO|nr:12133_t:CDS:2 [Funneliformis mosseae]
MSERRYLLWMEMADDGSKALCKCLESHTTARQQRWPHCERHTKIFAAQLVEQHLNSKIRKTFAAIYSVGETVIKIGTKHHRYYIFPAWTILGGGMEATAIYDDDNTSLAQKYWITKHAALLIEYQNLQYSQECVECCNRVKVLLSAVSPKKIDTFERSINAQF